MPDPTAATRAGTLYVVATPIGNLEDITLRALKVLKGVNLIAAEDTRRTATLLRHFDISTPVLSVHEHNEQQRAAAIAGRLAAGESVALVTDAGTPAVSDPGARLVHYVREAGFTVEPIPGASAVLAALSASGITADGFSFVGFPPSRLNTRKQWLERVVTSSALQPVVLFESPHRLLKTLKELALLVKHQIFVGRELTKLHEELRWGTPAELAERFASPRGEFTLVIPPAPASSAHSQAPTDADISKEFGYMTLNEPSSSRKETIRQVAEKLGLSVKTVYNSLERTKIG